jgi:predicted TIM-barrel fold metal-dependent hydrolase
MAFEDLRRGRLDIVPHYYTVDMHFYKEHLRGFLPGKFIDVHTHAGRLTSGLQPGEPEPTYWPGWITKGAPMTVPSLLQALVILFPGKDVIPVILGGGRRTNVDEATEYLIQELDKYPHAYGLMRDMPDWSEKELVERYERGRFCGLKPYLTMASPDIPHKQVTIFDFLPHHQIRVAEERGWVIMLHIPRAERLADPVNVDQLKEIADTYPDVKIILAHIGRAYCPRFAEEGFAALGDTAQFYYWDFSANLLQEAIEILIECAGPGRILYGSDLPVLAARARRICEGDNYVNIMREADWEDIHTRLAPPGERDKITFMVYEEILAFKRAAQSKGLTRRDIEDVFYNNAYQLLEGTG